MNKVTNFVGLEVSGIEDTEGQTMIFPGKKWMDALMAPKRQKNNA
jgi:hypothetical protein